MKVLKFGGTSVGSVESILSLKSIVEKQSQPVIVVVSALGGITDKSFSAVKLLNGFSIGSHGVTDDVFFHHVEGGVLLSCARNRVYTSRQQVALRGNLNVSVHS